MKQTISLPKSDYERLVNRVKALEKTVHDLVAKLKDTLDIEPPYGSDAWWEWSNKKGLEDIKKGDYYEMKNQKELKDFLSHTDDEDYIYNTFHHKSKKTAR